MTWVCFAFGNFSKVLTDDQDKGKMDEVKVEKSKDVGIIIDKRRCHCPAGFWKRGLEITGLSFVTLLYRVSHCHFIYTDKSAQKH